jgi:tol-pal system protein YbgF
MTFQRNLVRLSALAVLSFTFAVPRAHAVSKEMIQLQTQIQQLQDAVARLQQSNDERMGVLKDLAQRNADSINKMSVVVNGLKLSMQNQQDAAGTKSDQLSGQVQALNDSIDELKARLARMEKMLGDVQSQQQSANAVLNNLPQGTGAAAAAPSTPAPATTNQNPINGPAQGEPIPAGPVSSTAPRSDAPPVADMYRSAYNDYMAARYPLATTEFSDLIKAYPDDTLSGNANFYLGEISLRSAKPTSAVKYYDRLIERYPDSTKIPAAHLHKAEAMLSMKQTEGGIREMRSLIQRFPNSPEAAQARQKLSSMHVSSVPQ